MRREPGIEAEVEALAQLDLDGLRALWKRRFGRSPALRSVPLLQLLLAWRMQAIAQGGLDPATRRALSRKGQEEPEGLHLGHGAVLRRVWRGRVIEARVEAQGFVHEGRKYPSLSAIALTATGTRWNGPRFFGLRAKTGAAAEKGP